MEEEESLLELGTDERAGTFGTTGDVGEALAEVAAAAATAAASDAEVTVEEGASAWGKRNISVTG